MLFAQQKDSSLKIRIIELCTTDDITIVLILFLVYLVYSNK